MYAGIIEGVGARYCPSIEDKVMRFPEKLRHQIFLEPEGIETTEVYPNGLPTSLPLATQVAMIRSVKGLEKAVIVRSGYAIEYDYVDPQELLPSLETKKIRGLFLAGQINGTSGYEEAAAQGLIGGVNAVHYCRSTDPLVVDRSEAYIGVLIDDLVTRGTQEPYRLFTSRAEYRLLLREDNADARLSEIGNKIGLLPKSQYDFFVAKQQHIERGIRILETTWLKPSADIDATLHRLGSTGLKQKSSLADLLRRPELKIGNLADLCTCEQRPPVEELNGSRFREEIQLRVKYKGYIERQTEQVSRFKKLESTRIPQELDYSTLSGLSNEVVEKLSRVKPLSLGQASRISGITPAAISILQIHLRKHRFQANHAPPPVNGK
jgi:tRNA uridine 5-carboxymethylaminomethyl modification enzyme